MGVTSGFIGHLASRPRRPANSLPAQQPRSDDLRAFYNRERPYEAGTEAAGVDVAIRQLGPRPLRATNRAVDWMEIAAAIPPIHGAVLHPGFGLVPAFVGAPSPT